MQQIITNFHDYNKLYYELGQASLLNFLHSSSILND